MSGGSRPQLVSSGPSRKDDFTPRERLIVELLRLSADPFGAHAAFEEVRGNGQSPPIRPHEPHCAMKVGNTRVCSCWIRSLDEIDRALQRLKDSDRPCWYAVVHRYRLCERKPVDVLVKGGRARLELNQHALQAVTFIDWSAGTPHTVFRPGVNKRGDGRTRLLVETWRAGLDPECVRRGVVLLSELFVGMPQLPLELLKGAA